MYNPQQAVQYAERYWNGHNPAFLHFNDDCTNFISQCLWAGGMPMVFSNQPSRGWWYRRQGRRHTWSYSWTVAHIFYTLLTKGGPSGKVVQVSSAEELSLGDVICYDFEGDGRFNHNTIVTGKDSWGQPLVHAHTVNSRYRPWEYRDSHSWTPRVRYAFFRIR